VVGAGFVLYTVAIADLEATGNILAGAGPTIALAFLPYLFGMLAITGAWHISLAHLGFPLAFAPLLRLRMASEAILLSVPGGTVVAEAVKTWHLSRRLGVPLSETAASLAMSKAAIVTSNAVYVGLALFIAAGPLSRLGHQFGDPFLPWVAGVALLVCLALTGLISLAIVRNGSLVVGLAAFARRLPSARARRFVERHANDIANANETFRRFRAPGGTAAIIIASVLSLLMWLTEAIETYLIFQLLGLPVSFSEAILVEALGSTIRSAAFALPAGIGIQDLGIVFILAALGKPEAASMALAFSITKRSKEVFWIVTGYLLFLDRRAPVLQPGS
jgi:uncharacterized protein (TIRG00374 family)